MNYIRAVGISRFILVILCIALVLSVAVCGIDSWGLGGIFEKDTIRLGLDLSGGSIITYSAVTEDTGDTLAKGMNGILESMRTRLDSQGLTEANVYLVGDKMITLEIPNVTDPNEAVEQFGAAAVLTFRNADGDIILEGKDVAEAEAAYYQNEDGVAEWMVQLKLTDEGAEKFAAATKEAAANGTNITTYIDDELISTAGVDKEYAEEGITGGEASISGSFDRDSARALAGNINAGALAYNLSLEELRAVGPTLGEKSLETSLKAGAIGLLLVAVFMIIYYRIPGLMASIALCAYVGLFMLVLALTKANLTLPGIAGIILSIGMAVDANVLVFATPIYYYEMSGQLKTMLDRANSLYESDYKFQDVYMLSTAAEEEAGTDFRAVQGLEGWIACFERARLAGTVFAVGVNDPGQIEGHPAIEQALAMGRNV